MLLALPKNPEIAIQGAHVSMPPNWPQNTPAIDNNPDADTETDADTYTVTDIDTNTDTDTDTDTETDTGIDTDTDTDTELPQIVLFVWSSACMVEIPRNRYPRSTRQHASKLNSKYTSNQ